MAVKNKKKQKGVKPSNIPVKTPEAKRVEPDEWYKAKFIEASVEEGLYGDYLMLKFELLSGYIEDKEDSAKGLPFYSFANIPINPMSDAAVNISAIIGKTVEEDVDIDLTPHYGKSYKVLVSDKRNKKSKDIKQQITKIKKYVKKAS